MYERPDPEGAEPSPYLPAWLDGTPVYGQQSEQPYGEQPHSEQPHGPQSYGEPQAFDGQGSTYDAGVVYEQPSYGGRPGGEYVGEYSGQYGGPYTAQYGRADSVTEQEEPPPYEPVDRYLPAVPAPRTEVARSAAASGEGRPRRALRGRGGERGRGRTMRSVLALAALACLGVFGYWGWTFYEGSPKTVQEGDCIAALSGDDVKPLACTDQRARFMVQEIFEDSTDVKMCSVVLGSTNPLVVDREGRSDVWCVGPK